MTKIQKAAVNQWIVSSKRDLTLSDKLFNDKVYNYSLFFLQLSIEKILKAVFISKFNDYPPYSHDLVFLARKAKIDFFKQHLNDFKEISGFHIAARYDNEKFEFYKKATKGFAANWLEIGKTLYNKLSKLI